MLRANMIYIYIYISIKFSLDWRIRQRERQATVDQEGKCSWKKQSDQFKSPRKRGLEGVPWSNFPLEIGREIKEKYR